MLETLQRQKISWENKIWKYWLLILSVYMGTRVSWQRQENGTSLLKKQFCS